MIQYLDPKEVKILLNASSDDSLHSVAKSVHADWFTTYVQQPGELFSWLSDKLKGIDLNPLVF